MKTFNTASIEAFLSFCQSKGMSKETERAYRSDLNQLLSNIGEKSDADELEKAVSAWLGLHRTVWKARTTRRKISAYRSIAKFLGTDLLVNYHSPKPDRLVAHPLDGGMPDVHRLIAACHTGREAALVALCGLLGLRVAEALAVVVNDFDFHARTLTVRNGKGAKDRTIPVPDVAWPPLFRGISEQPINTKPLVPVTNRHGRRILTAIGRRIGLELSSHDLRSTLLTAMYQASKDLRAVQEYAGHSDSKTTEAYTGIRMRDMRAALEGAV